MSTVNAVPVSGTYATALLLSSSTHYPPGHHISELELREPSDEDLAAIEAGHEDEILDRIAVANVCAEIEAMQVKMERRRYQWQAELAMLRLEHAASEPAVARPARVA
jgi:hypothetical protein